MKINEINKKIDTYYRCSLCANIHLFLKNKYNKKRKNRKNKKLIKLKKHKNIQKGKNKEIKKNMKKSKTVVKNLNKQEKKKKRNKYIKVTILFIFLDSSNSLFLKSLILIFFSIIIAS